MTLAVLAGVLAVTLVLQLAIPRALPLPEPGVVRPFALPTERVVALAGDPAIVARPIFGASVAGGMPVGPIDGATAIGVMSRAGARIAFVQDADGKVASLTPGQVFHGWRLRAVDRDALLFDQGGRSVSLPVTAAGHGAPPPTQAAPTAPLAHPLD